MLIRSEDSLPQRDHARAQELELLRLLAATERVRTEHAERIIELAESVNLGTLYQTLHERRLLALLGQRLLDVAGPSLSDAMVDRLSSDVARARRRGVVFEAATARLMTALEANGIPAVGLKGAMLGARVYGDSGMRTASDIDLLISHQDFDAAIEIFSHEGYRTDRATRLVRSGAARIRFVGDRAWSPPVELHSSITSAGQRFSSALLARSAVDARWGRLPALLDELALLLIFYAAQGFIGLRLAADIAGWWDRFGSSLPPRALTPAVATYPELAHSLIAGAAVADQLVGVPFETVLDPQRAGAWRAATAAALANWRTEGSIRDLQAEAVLVGLLLSSRLDARDICRTLATGARVAPGLPRALRRIRTAQAAPTA